MTDGATDPFVPSRVRDILNGDIADDAQVRVRGALAEVTVRTNDQSGQWASARLVDGTDSIDILVFPRAFAVTGTLRFDTDVSVDVTARVSVSARRTTLVVNSMIPTDPGAA